MKRGRNQRRRQGVNPNRALDSNGPDVRIRGTANQIYDKYQALARDASSSGDRIKAESYLQHAEHYFRLIRSMQVSQQPQSPAPQAAADGESEQPAVENDDEPRRAPRARRAAQQETSEADAEDSAASEVKAEETKAAAGDESEEAEKPAAEKKPRRRRAPRRAAKRADDAAAEESAPDAAAAPAAE